MEPGVDEQLPLSNMESAEVHPVGVAQEPGGFVVQRLRAIFQLADPERDIEEPALLAERLAGGRCGHGGPD
jgi:hypothetical protein